MSIADIGELCIIACGVCGLAGLGMALHIQWIEWRRCRRMDREMKAALRSGEILTGRKGGAA